MTLIKNIKLGTPVTTGVKLLGTKADGATGNFSIDDIKTYIESGVSLEYTLPESIGTAGQVLQVPAVGTELEWSNSTISLTTLGTGGTSTLVGGVLNIPQSLASINIDLSALTPYLNGDKIMLPPYVLGGEGNEGDVQRVDANGDFIADGGLNYKNGILTMNWMALDTDINLMLFNKSRNWILDGNFGSISYKPISNSGVDSYELTANDAGITKVFSNTNKVQVTIPDDADVEHKIGTEIEIIKIDGVDNLEIVTGASNRVNGENGVVTKTLSTYSIGKLKKISGDTWVFAVMDATV